MSVRRKGSRAKRVGRAVPRGGVMLVVAFLSLPLRQSHALPAANATAGQEEAGATAGRTAWRARLQQYRGDLQRYRAERRLANRAIELGRELRHAGVRPTLDDARHQALLKQQVLCLLPAAASALSIATHTLLPGVYWFWQTLLTKAVGAAGLGVVGLSALAGTGMASDYLTVREAEKRDGRSAIAAAAQTSAEFQPVRVWAAKVQALLAAGGAKAPATHAPADQSAQAEGQTHGPHEEANPGLGWLLSREFREGRRAARTFAELARAAAPADHGRPARSEEGAADADSLGEAAPRAQQGDYREQNGIRLVGRAVGFGFLGLAALDVATIAFVLVAPIHWYVGFAIAKSAVFGSAFVAMSRSAGRARRELEAAATISAGAKALSQRTDLTAEDQAALSAWATARLAPMAEGDTLLKRLWARYTTLVTKNEADAEQLRALVVGRHE